MGFKSIKTTKKTDVNYNKLYQIVTNIIYITEYKENGGLQAERV